MKQLERVEKGATTKRGRTPYCVRWRNLCVRKSPSRSNQHFVQLKRQDLIFRQSHHPDRIDSQVNSTLLYKMGLGNGWGGGRKSQSHLRCILTAHGRTKCEGHGTHSAPPPSPPEWLREEEREQPHLVLWGIRDSSLQSRCLPSQSQSEMGIHPSPLENGQVVYTS